jgi:hypothetical protein
VLNKYFYGIYSAAGTLLSVDSGGMYKIQSCGANCLESFLQEKTIVRWWCSNSKLTKTGIDLGNENQFQMY